jgi:hypothetical protein
MSIMISLISPSVCKHIRHDANIREVTSTFIDKLREANDLVSVISPYSYRLWNDFVVPSGCTWCRSICLSHNGWLTISASSLCHQHVRGVVLYV